MKKKKTTSIVPYAVVLGAGAFGAIVLAQTGKPATKPVMNPSSSKVKDEPTQVELVKADRKPLAYYTGAVRPDLFGTPAAPPAAAPKVTVKAPPPVVKETAPVEVIDPFVDYAYSGTVTMAGEPLALVENKKTREGQYLKIGDSFLGGKVATINDRSISIDVAGNSKSLAKTDDFNLTPLNANAAFLNEKPPVPGSPQPGAQGAPGAAMFGPGGRGNWQNMSQEQRDQMRQQFLQNLTPEQRDRMQQRRMDRQFNGGGRGGRRGNGGGFGGGGFGGGFGG